MLIEKMRYKTNNKFNIFIKKVVAMSVIVTNLSFAIPIASFAEDSKSDTDQKYPALVPVAADSIISKFVSTKFSGSNASSSSSGGIITNYEEKGDGWNSTTTVEYPNGVKRTYRNYKQYKGSYADVDYWENKIWSDGCGPTSVAIVLSGYGYDYNPGKVVATMDEKKKDTGHYSVRANMFESIKDTIDIEVEAHDGVSSNSAEEIRNNFKNGRPVIVNAPGHYVVYLGEDENGKLIISDPGENDGNNSRYGETLEDMLSSNCKGYVLIKSDGNASSNNNNNNTSSKKSTSENEKNVSNSTGNNLRWPVGSEEITNKDGKEFAIGTPALGTNNVSRGGVSRGWSGESHEKNEGQALDIHSNGQSGVYNVVAMGNGIVTSCGDGIAEGDRSGNRRNG